MYSCAWAFELVLDGADLDGQMRQHDPTASTRDVHWRSACYKMQAHNVIEKQYWWWASLIKYDCKLKKAVRATNMSVALP